MFRISVPPTQAVALGGRHHLPAQRRRTRSMARIRHSRHLYRLPQRRPLTHPDVSAVAVADLMTRHPDQILVGHDVFLKQMWAGAGKRLRVHPDRRVAGRLFGGWRLGGRWRRRLGRRRFSGGRRRVARLRFGARGLRLGVGGLRGCCRGLFWGRWGDIRGTRARRAAKHNSHGCNGIQQLRHAEKIPLTAWSQESGANRYHQPGNIAPVGWSDGWCPLHRDIKNAELNDAVYVVFPGWDLVRRHRDGHRGPVPLRTATLRTLRRRPESMHSGKDGIQGVVE
jgi:hypothetical protein